MTSSKVWLMYKNEQESIEILTMAIQPSNLSLIFLEENASSSQIEKEKLVALLRSNRGVVDENEDENDYDEELLDIDLTKTDLKEAYLKLIFEPYRFSKSNIHKALGVS